MNRSAASHLPAPAQSDELRRRLPSVDRLLANSRSLVLLEVHGHGATVAAFRAVLEAARGSLAQVSEASPLAAIDEADLLARAELWLVRQSASRLRSVLNLTGTVLHTNLGRALLPPEAVLAMQRAASEPVSLEYDLDRGSRGDRDAVIEPLLRELTGAEAATVVNNNAAAVLLCLSALAGGRQAIVSRGELVEIGGAFRIPDIMRRAQVRLVEVGTTNRTRVSDFEQAISARTALLMRVHTSNYQIVGFTEAPTTEALAQLAHRFELPLIEDLGSGALVDLTRFGLPREPVVADSIRQGVDVVTFSGDKLLGGPQAGIIVGRRDLVDRIKRDPLKRALRVDKVTLAALEAVLQLYRDPDRLSQRLPTLRWLSRPVAQIELVARQLADGLAVRLAPLGWRVEVRDCASMIGSGSQPVERLSSFAVVVCPAGRASGTRLRLLEKAFRSLSRPVIGRIQDQAFWLDCRMLESADAVLAAVGELQLK